MSTSEFDKYKVDHLFLLIGENPLPNYVAAKTLLKEGGSVYLVHTTHTEKSAEELQKILKSELNGFKDVQLRSLGDYESDAFHIQKKIKEELQKIKSGKIGLNYTGGTKAMAVHSYRAAFANPDTIFSYLDPRRLEICIDREDGERQRLKIKPSTLQVQLVTIFKLHKLELKQDLIITKPLLATLATELAKIFQDKDKTKQWFDWYCKTFCEEARIKKKDGSWGDWKSTTNLEKKLIGLDNLPKEVIIAFQEEKFITNDNKLALSVVKTIDGFSKIEKFCKWLDGLWLEHYVLKQVENIASNNFIGDYGLNFEIPLKGTKDGFEFDVAFTRGYQLFALSCTTTSDRKLCKSKLFEAYLRARRMGGDEARVALICCSNDHTLKAEIADSTNDDKIQVFGREHLKNLAQEIADWINQNDREASK